MSASRCRRDTLPSSTHKYQVKICCLLCISFRFESMFTQHPLHHCQSALYFLRSFPYCDQCLVRTRLTLRLTCSPRRSAQLSTLRAGAGKSCASTQKVKLTNNFYNLETTTVRLLILTPAKHAARMYQKGLCNRPAPDAFGNTLLLCAVYQQSDVI